MTDDEQPVTGASPAIAPLFNAPPAGYRLQEYSFDSMLGHGGFGIRYLATDHNLNCQVAIKEFLPAERSTGLAGFRCGPTAGKPFGT
jgi:serine/threonine protein kinase